ncbi:MAG: hypothetical protein KTR32_09080 [Granulosicoccus sp.]|nr:hypothetical protein [Granulosicoccus sp.]
MMTTVLYILRSTFFALLLFLVLTSTALTQEKPLDSKATSEETVQLMRLEALGKLLEKKSSARDQLEKRLNGVAEGTMLDERSELESINRDIGKLNSTFEMVALGDTDTSVLEELEQAPTTWQEDLLDILKPLIDSLKALTKRPRQIAELRDLVANGKEKLEVTDQALSSLQKISEAELDSETSARLDALILGWKDEQEQFAQETLVAQSQLTRLSDEKQSFVSGIWPATRDFLLGRGFTLMLVLLSALVVWSLMRIIWWIYTTRFTSERLRKHSTWFRVAAYSYYLLTSMVIVFVALFVLYIREDLLLLALALLVIAGLILSLRHFLPRYVHEARLLLNLGSVREDERVVYNGLPWLVESINLHSVLRNPELDGVVRLPLDVISDLVSRPVKNNLWFPSSKDDYVILPDGVLGQINHQTPDLVEINVRGGMSLTYNTSDFYALNLINLSRQDTYGVSVTFGFDYSHQSISLTEIPDALYSAVHATLLKAGYKEHIRDLMVELATANTSSMDYLVFATMSSQVASDYYKIERLIQQSCIAVSNEKNWTIPFPQLTVHQTTV